MSEFPSNFCHTFFDSQTLYKEDVNRLQPGVWVNDSIINFYYLYLENEKYPDRKDILFVVPNLSYWVKEVQTFEDVEEAVDPIDLPSRNLVFIPVNDASGEDAGGNHWSLLVYVRNKDTYYYYDSVNTHNLGTAKKLAKKFHPFMKSQQKEAKFQTRPTPQQANGSDCGLFVMALTDYLAGSNGDDESLNQSVNNSTVQKLRFTVKSLIKEVYDKETKKK